MLIDVTSFTSGPRQIENAVKSQQNANHIAVAQAIDGYIAHYQPVFLRSVVGDKWCSLFDAYSKVDHVQANEDEDETPAEPTDEDITIASLIDLLKEPFANFVFFHMLRDMNTQVTITGVVNLKCANSYVSPIDRGVRVWNEMVDQLKAFTKTVYELKVLDVATDEDMLTYINQFNL